jgi:hypothetical protein
MWAELIGIGLAPHSCASSFLPFNIVVELNLDRLHLHLRMHAVFLPLRYDRWFGNFRNRCRSFNVQSRLIVNRVFERSFEALILDPRACSILSICMWSFHQPF